MVLDPQVCYRALVSRDRRFDGRFFTGVTTTGIYCRPVCPARTPRRSSCRFFRCAAEAGEAGFRPCLRCRPESAPGTPAWLGPSATVTRALRLIREGALDGKGGGVDALARRLGVGTRHLRRLFQAQLGTSPLAVAQTRRIQLGKKLIDETGLSVTRIAASTGFGSLRRFNAAFHRAYGASPTKVRRGRVAARPRSADLELRLSYRPPYDWESMLDFLRARAVAGVEEVADGTYRRTIALGGEGGILEVRCASERASLVLRVPAGLAGDAGTIVERVRRLFDLDADPASIAERLGADPLLMRSVRRRPGLRVPGAWDRFELAVRAVLGQQVTVAGAATLAGRLARRFGRPLAEPTGGLSHLFPDSTALAGADLSSIGLPGARQRSILALAAAVEAGTLDLDAPLGLEQARGALSAIPGFGEWTAQYVALRALGEPDAFPASDLGVRRALAAGDRLPSPSEVVARAEAWRPWRAYATLHLWVGDAASGAARTPLRAARATG